MEAAISVQNLKKNYGNLAAVDGVSFNVAQGEVFSLLGPNGAGKTTTINLLCCLLAPTAGDAWVMGHSVKSESLKVKAAIGVVPQDIALYEDLSAGENLAFWGKIARPARPCAAPAGGRGAGDHRPGGSPEGAG